MKKYVVRLTDEEREICLATIANLKGSSQKAHRARILLQVDAEGPNWTDQQTAAAFRCHQRTVENVRRRCVLEGFQRALEDREWAELPVPKLLNGVQEAQIIALGLGPAPPGYGNWSLRLLAKQVVELGIVDSISHNTGRNTLKKNGITGRKLQYWVIPLQENADFAASMEEVLDTYERPYDSEHPVICMNEQPVQLVQETRTPVEATKTHPKRVDYKYERAGTAAVFMFCEPMVGWRDASVHSRRTKADWAQAVAALAEGRYAHCERITLVLDSPNTHTKGAFYEAFELLRARKLAKRIELCFTPKHGSWLNIAEVELSTMARQCLHHRRIGTIDALQDEITAWLSDTNTRQRGVDWRMTTEDARCKLKFIYPKIKS